MKDLGFKIRRLRELKNFTQEYISQELGISLRTYQRIESGKSQVSVIQFVLLTKILEINLEDLLASYTGSQNQDNSSSNFPFSHSFLEKENARLEAQISSLRSEKERLMGILERLLEK